MEKLLKAQLRTSANIQNFLENSTSKVGADRQTLVHFQTRLELLENYWRNFTDRHDDLLEFEEKLVKHDYFSEDAYSGIEMEYVNAKTQILEKINALKPSTANNAPPDSNQQQIIRDLPKLALPTFSGNQDDWESFKQRFSALVKDKASVPPVVKLQHLLNAVQGPAAQRLKGIEITDANFDVAWDKLTRRYDNPRVRLFNRLENLINLPAVRNKNIQDLNVLMDRAEELVRALRDLQCPIDHTNYFVVHCIVRKLDLRSRETWEISQESTEGFSTYADLIRFLERRIQSLEQAHTTGDSSDSRGHPNDSSKPRRVSANAVQATGGSNSPPRCILCKGNHPLHRCNKFNAMPVSQRSDLCRRDKLCVNCLQRGHFRDSCPSNGRCFVCKEKHHTKLHFESKASGGSQIDKQGSQTIESASSSNNSAEGADSITTAHNAAVGSRALLATARIVVTDALGKSLTIRALIDPAAERSFVTQRVASQLSLNTKRVNISVIGVGAESASRALKEVVMEVRSSVLSTFRHKVLALVLDELTQYLPGARVEPASWPHIQGIELADSQFATPAKVNCILGADIYPAIIQSGIIRGPPGTPIAQKSVFGWLLTGSVAAESCSCNSMQVRVFHTHTEPALSENLQRFWEIEEGPRKARLTDEEQACEEHFKITYTRNQAGRFVVRLPFRSDPTFDNSREIALACLLRSERRLQCKPELAELYNGFMTEFRDLKHMEPVPREQLNRPSFYMPHHAVVRPENPSKIRVVFNASQRASNGSSLNDTLMPGPKLQADIALILINWRFFRYVYTTDVVKMFRQIQVHPDDADWQRIVWRPDASQPIQDYRCTTVTYGTASAPFIALRVMKQLAEDGADKYPNAAEVLRERLYVDDLFDGADDLGLAISHRDQLIQLLASAGMQLDKWAANDRQLLHGVTSTSAEEIDVRLDEVVSTLGLKWIPKVDVFFFNASIVNYSSDITKRIVLSELARLFDPLGWLAPIVVTAKIVLQDLWINELAWDTALPSQLAQRWQQFRDELRDVSLIRIPRWIGGKTDDAWHLHGFADASSRAYAAAVFAVRPGHTSTLLMAKSKLAPTKVQSLPRLELCGAALLARLINHLTNSFKHQPVVINCWTDSKVVLEWLKSHPSRWQTFVANRTSEIITTLPTARWRHVRSADNPADCATRGLSPAALADHKLWWQGPAWLTLHETAWPNASTADVQISTETRAFVCREEKQQEEATHGRHQCLLTLQKQSSFSRMLRILAFCCRWRLRTTRKCSNQQLAAPTSEELRMALLACFRHVQMQHFSTERRLLLNGKGIPSRSPLAKLSPFICGRDLIRVGGRLQHACLPYNERHPIVLPGSCVLVRRLVEETHKLTMHGGPQLMLSHLRRSVWIIGGSRLASGVYHRCITCTRFAARPTEQLMGNLPAVRVKPSRPFSHTGVDYAGPIPVLFSRGRGAKTTKGYVAIFICMVVRAVHIEVVSDLSADAFLAAYSRFCARRGVPVIMYSDNATNFKGAAAEVQQLFRDSTVTQRITESMAAQGTQWSFIPPRAPHFGGLWEAAVRSFKHHFRRVIGENTLTFEELATLAAKIEACLNSRPLCPISNEASDELALTPAHFLVGSPVLISHPEPYDEREREPAARIVNRWKLLTNLRDSFWARWRKEVLHHLQLRNKWLKPQQNIQRDDVVLIKDELTPPTRWPLGLVIDVHQGSDGLVRVVTVKTADSTFVRPIVKLVKLPTEPELERCFDSKAKAE